MLFLILPLQNPISNQCTDPPLRSHCTLNPAGRHLTLSNSPLLPTYSPILPLPNSLYIWANVRQRNQKINTQKAEKNENWNYEKQRKKAKKKKLKMLNKRKAFKVPSPSPPHPRQTIFIISLQFSTILWNELKFLLFTLFSLSHPLLLLLLLLLPPFLGAQKNKKSHQIHSCA